MSLTLRTRAPHARPRRRLPRFVDVLLITIAGAIFLLPLNSTAKGCDEGAKCIESAALTQAGPSQAAVVATQADSGNGTFMSMDTTMMMLALAVGVVMYTFFVMYRRDTSVATAAIDES